MLELPALAKRVSLEGTTNITLTLTLTLTNPNPNEFPNPNPNLKFLGRNAIKTYEDATGQTISPSNRDKICKHFARVEVSAKTHNKSFHL